MAVTLNQLSSFLAVAREGSVSAAAEKLFVTQPSISAAVSALSRELGVDLTERVGRGVGLTAAGLAFRPYAADVLGLVEQGRQAAREAADLSMRSLRLVAVATAAEYVVPALLRSFAGMHPEIHLSLEVANRATVFERVLEHEVDVAIAGRPPEDARIAGSAFLRNELALIAAPEDELVGSAAVDPRQLADRVWLQREPGSGTRQLLAEFLSEHDLRPQTLTLGSNGAIKEAVRLGLGVSLQSRVAVEQELEAGALAELRVKGGLPEREWYSLHSATVPPRPAVALFLEFVHGVGAGRAFAGHARVSAQRIPVGQIAPSLLSADFARLEQQVVTVMDAGARVMHVDVMDGHFVPPITIGPLIVEALRDLVHDRGGILDCHLMVERPEQHVDAFVKAGADVITIHPEATPHIHYGLKMIRDAGVAAGVVINPGTPVEAVEPVADLIDLCLLMSVNPGWGGQRYIPSSTGRLARLRELIPPEVVLQVDGGISLETIDEARDAGTDLFVAGSSVFGADDPAAAFAALSARLGDH